MKWSLLRTHTIAAVAIIALTLSAGALVGIGIRLESRQIHAHSYPATIQLELEKLEQIHCQARAAHAPIAPDNATAALLALHEASMAIDAQNSSHGTDGGAETPPLANQMDSLRESYLTLLSTHNESIKSQQLTQELLTLIDQRLSLLPPTLIDQVQPDLDLLRIQINRLSLPGDNSQPEALEDIHHRLVAHMSDPTVKKSMDLILDRCRQEIASQAAIRDQEQTLSQLSSSFASQAEATNNEFVSALALKETWCQGLTFLALLSLAAISGLLLVLTKRRLDAFQKDSSLITQSFHADNGGSPPRHLASDELERTLKLIEEVTGHLAQEQILALEYRQRWQTLFDAMEEWVLICDANDTCTASNARAKDLVGLEAAQVIAHPLAAVLEGHVGATLNPGLAHGLASQSPFEHSQDIQHQNGSLIPVIIKGQPIFDPAGLFQGFTLLIRNLSKKRHAEVLLSQATQATKFLNQVLELALLNADLPDLIDRFVGLLAENSWLGIQPNIAFFLLDRKSHCLALTAHRGIDSQVITSCSLLPIGTCLCGRAAQSGKVIFADCHDPRHEMRYAGMALHGHYCLPVHTVAGEIIGVVALYLPPGHPRDGAVESILNSATTMIGSIIRRRQAEDEIKSLNQNLEQLVATRTAQLTAANQELDAFGYSVSHDLRAPLRAVDGFSQAISEDYGPDLPPQAQDYLARIRAGCTRMESLINDLLQLSRLTRFELKRERVNISQLAQDISEEIRAESPHRMVEWQITPTLEVMADPTMTRAALTNLLANAWKYSEHTAKAKIEFGRLSNDVNQVVFFVRDNGAGFDMRYSDKLFKPFQRLHSAGQYVGNGIGLATVQRIIHRHGGTIWAEGKVGEGATFYFTLSGPE